jgi:hypothetical protein
VTRTGRPRRTPPAPKGATPDAASEEAVERGPETGAPLHALTPRGRIAQARPTFRITLRRPMPATARVRLSVRAERGGWSTSWEAALPAGEQDLSFSLPEGEEVPPARCLWAIEVLDRPEEDPLGTAARFERVDSEKLRAALVGLRPTGNEELDLVAEAIAARRKGFTVHALELLEKPLSEGESPGKLHRLVQARVYRDLADDVRARRAIESFRTASERR